MNVLMVLILRGSQVTLQFRAASLHDGFAGVDAAGNVGGGQDGVVDADGGGGLAVVVGDIARILTIGTRISFLSFTRFT